MFKFRKRTELGVAIVKKLRENSSGGVCEVSPMDLALAFPHATKTEVRAALYPLTSASLIKRRPGRNGGVVYVQPSITLYQIAEAGNDLPVYTVLTKDGPLKKIYQEMENQLRSEVI